MAEEEIRDYPLLAVVLAILGGLAIFFVGLFVAAVGSAIATLTPAGSLLALSGGFAAFLGLLIILLAIYLVSHSESSVPIGLAIIVLSALSFVGGGGAFLGAILGIVAGVLSLIYQSDVDAIELPDLPTSLGASARIPVRCASCGFPRTAAEGSNRCGNCGAPIA